MNKKIISVALSTVTIVMMSGAFLAPVASAQTTDVASQIAALMAQIQALQSQLNAAKGVSSVASYNYTRSLTVGSKGADVTALQNMLIAAGDLNISAATTYFGPLTKAALAKWQSANSVSPASGYFGAISRAKVASMAAASGTTGTTTTGTTGTTVTTATSSASGMTVSVASDNPAATNVPINLSSTAVELIPVLKLNFSAGSSAVTVTGLNVTRTGLSADSDLSNVYLMKGNVVVATNLGISSGVINFSNGAGLFTVNANQTQEITVAISINSGLTAGGTYQFAVASASAITSNASAVSASFPITGNTMTGSLVSNLGGLQINNSSPATSSTSGLSINAGQKNYLVGQFTMVSQNQPIQVKSITLTQTGSVAPTNISNYALYNGGTLLSTVAGISGQTITFDLSANPLQLAAGNSDTMYVYVDIVGGVNRNFQMSIQHNYDVIASDMMFNFGILPSLTGNTSSAYPANFSYVSVSAGTLTVSRDANSPTNYALPGATNQTVAKIDMSAAGEAIRIIALDVDLTGTTAANTSTITNIKVVDDQGQQIGTTKTSITTLTTPVVLTNLNYLIPANTTRVISVIMDLSTSASTNIVAGLTSIVGQGYTSLMAVLGGPIYGNTLTANSTMLSAYVNNAVGSVSLVAGQKNVKIASFSLNAGAASPVSVSNMSLTTAGNVATNYQNMKVMVGLTQIGQTYGSLASSTVYAFSPSTAISIPVGQQAIVDVYVDTLTSGTTWVAGNVVSLTTVSAIATLTGQATAAINSATGQSVTLNSTGGTVSIAAYQLPAAQQIGMGTSNVKLATYQITGSATEAMTVQNVYLDTTSTVAGSVGGNNLFSNYRLMNGSTVVASSPTTLNTASATTSLEFVGVNYSIPQNGYVNLDVVGDAETYSASNNAVSGIETASTNPTMLVLMNKVDAIGASSGQTISTTTTSSQNGNAMQLVRTVITPANASSVALGGSYSSSELVGAFTFSNVGPDASTPNATLSTTTLALNLANATSGASTATTTITITDVKGNSLLGSTAITLGSATPVALSSTYAQVPYGGSLTIYIYANTSINSINTRPSGSNSQITMNSTLSAYNWTDGTRTGLSANTYPSNLLPITTGNAVVN